MKLFSQLLMMIFHNNYYFFQKKKKNIYIYICIFSFIVIKFYYQIIMIYIVCIMVWKWFNKLKELYIDIKQSKPHKIYIKVIQCHESD